MMHRGGLADVYLPRNRLRNESACAQPKNWNLKTYLVNASLFLFSRLCPVSAPLSLFFIAPNDCLVGNTASLSYESQGP